MSRPPAQDSDAERPELTEAEAVAQTPADEQPPPAAAGEPERPRRPPPSPATQQFVRALYQLTPRTLVTLVLVVLNVGLFVVMLAAGVDPFTPDAQTLVQWGATHAPLTASGQWWRLLSAMFVHVGLLHVAMNMWVLWSIGPLVERLLGNLAFLVAYLVSGLAGGLVSLWWNPVAVSAGASGAIFGVFGVLFAFVLVRRRLIPLDVLRPLRSSMVIFLGFNLLFGLMHKGVDMAAHSGGLAAGFACALVLSHPLTERGRRSRWWRTLVTALCGGALVAGATQVLRNDAWELQQALQRFATVEQRSIKEFNDSLKLFRRSEIDAPQMAQRVRRLLPDWRRAAEAIDAITRRGKLPQESARQARATLRYMKLRQRGWQLLAEALEQNSRTKADRAGQLLKQAEQLVQQQRQQPP